jgi:hypothetical protein
MTSHESFGHLQPKLWEKEGLGVKLAIWLLTTKSRESTWSRRAMRECDMALESSREELQYWFRTCPNWRLRREVMMAQSPRSPNRDKKWSLGTKNHLGVGVVEQRRKYYMGERWWLPLSESKVARGLSQHQKGAEWVLTNLWLVLDARPCNKIIVPLPSLIPGLLACPSYPL